MNFPLVTEAPPLSTDETGAIRVGDTRILLELVIRAFQAGATPEAIVQRYSSLHLSDVYFTIGYYLKHPAEIDEYLVNRERQAIAVEEKLIIQQPKINQMRDRLLKQLER